MDATATGQISGWLDTTLCDIDLGAGANQEAIIFQKNVDWFIENHQDISERNMASMRKREGQPYPAFTSQQRSTRKDPEAYA
jgi:hypothetical protein